MGLLCYIERGMGKSQLRPQGRLSGQERRVVSLRSEGVPRSPGEAIVEARPRSIRW